MLRLLNLCVAIMSLFELVLSEGKDPCAKLKCEFPDTCIICNVTGYPKCFPDCGNKNGGCSADQICEVATSQYFDGKLSLCEPYIKCRDPPYVVCDSDVSLDCDKDFLYCLQQNKTRQAFCIPSCFSNNGGCSNDKICITASGEEEEKVTGQVKCISPNDFTSGCPAGQQMDQCGNRYQQTCDDILSGYPCPSLEICDPPACVCPTGLVLFRDRCVDPRLCHNLVTYPPAIDPLPLQDNQLLYSFNSNSLFIDFMKDPFLIAVEVVLVGSGFVDVMVDLHGIYWDESLQIVVQLSGDDVDGDSPTQFLEIFNTNSHQLPLAIIAVSPVTPRNVDEECNDLLTFVLLISASTACLVTILIFLVIMVISIVYAFKSRAVYHNNLKIDVNNRKAEENVYMVDEEKTKLEFFSPLY